VLQSEKLISKVMRHEQALFAKRNNQRPAWQIMKWRPGFAAGSFAPAICPEAITFLLLKNF
jgi:hypothetical protein